MHRTARHQLTWAVCAILCAACGNSGSRSDNPPVATATSLPATATIAQPSATAAPTVFPSPVPSPTHIVAPTSTAAVSLTPTPTVIGTPPPTPFPCDLTSPCFGGRFCELPSGVCGTALDHGVCVDVAPQCPDTYAPVCGCDGLTYGNECLRRGARVQPAQDGACATIECEDDCNCYANRAFVLPCPLDCANCDNFWTCQERHCFEHCGFVPLDRCETRCSSNADCASNQWCEKAAGQCDGLGACVLRPQICLDFLDPVCGCDGRTHGNDCYRQRAGVVLAHTGACGQPSVGFVTVRVSDPSLGGVAGVDITIAGTEFSAKTNQDGLAMFELPAGDYFVDAQVCCAGPGYIDHHRPITVETGKRIEVALHACLRCICASPDTAIATPDGETPIYALKVGDLVYSIDRGQVVAVPIAATNRVAVQAHHVVHVALANGGVLDISPGHPTADGRTVGDLHPGDRLGDVEILGVELVPYAHDHTYDILPASDTGIYFAAGVPLGSTLFTSDTANTEQHMRIEQNVTGAAAVASVAALPKRGRATPATAHHRESRPFRAANPAGDGPRPPQEPTERRGVPASGLLLAPQCGRPDRRQLSTWP